MVNPVGFRFRPTDVEIIDHYLRLKNNGGKSRQLDEVMNTITICSVDPWDLPSQSRIKTEDQVWYFFSRKENKYNKGVQQIRKTKSGFWKKTGVTMDIMCKKATSRERIGEKRVLVFHSSGGSKSNWVMHEYHSTNQMMMTYTICKVQFKGEATKISSGYEIEHSHHHSLPIHMNNYGGLTSGPEGSSSELLSELQNPNPLSDFLDEQQETQLDDAIQRAFENLSSYDWQSLLDICNNSSQKV